jgi:hypothetical protein
MTVSPPAQCVSPADLARKAALFREGTKRIYEGQGDRADMWFFELWHFLGDVEEALAHPQPAAGAEREAVIEECARELETAFPHHAWLNAACATLRSMRTTSLSPVRSGIDRDSVYDAALKVLDTKHLMPTSVMLATKIADEVCAALNSGGGK